MSESGVVKSAAMIARYFHIDPLSVLKSSYYDFALRSAAYRYAAEREAAEAERAKAAQAASHK